MFKNCVQLLFSNVNTNNQFEKLTACNNFGPQVAKFLYNNNANGIKYWSIYSKNKFLIRKVFLPLFLLDYIKIFFHLKLYPGSFNFSRFSLDNKI